MSRKANPTAIGSFILGAIALVVVGILIFGKGEYFKTKYRLVMFFTGSVTGLDPGAPVKLRGVTIGKVVAVRAMHDPRATGKDALLIPVYIEIEQGRVRDASTGQPDAVVDDDQLRRELQVLIDEGLRARLELEILVTGKLYIEIDFHPDTPVGLVKIDVKKVVMELPTIPSAKQELVSMLESLRDIAAKLAELDVQTISQKTVSLLGGLDEIVHAPEIPETLTALHGLVKKMDARFDALYAELTDTLGDARAALRNANVLVGDTRGLVRRTDAHVADVAKSAVKALDQTRATLRTLQTAVDERSPIRHELTKMMTELAAAARSARLLANYLERHPEALLRGKHSGAR